MENRGGARPGSGPKPAFGISEREMKRLMTELRKKAKEKGQNWQARFVEHLYSDDWREEAAFFKMLTDKLFVKTSENESTVTTHAAPAIVLPEQLPDPAKVLKLVPPSNEAE